MEKGGLRRDEARSFVRDLGDRWRGDAVRLGERAGDSLQSVFSELGLVRRDDYDELELRVAQLEHRLRLLEKPATTSSEREHARAGHCLYRCERSSTRPRVCPGWQYRRGAAA